MAKIYVSSTFLDLKEHREQVERVIRRMGHTDVAMEYYVAEDARPVAKCLADVTACDVYVGIYAWRYGWIPTEHNPTNLSITEMEFRQAEDKNKPCLIFLLSDDAPWLKKHIDKDTSKIESLRNTASAHHNPDYFMTPDELARKVAEAIYKRIPVAVPIPEHDLTAYFTALRKRYGVLTLEGLTPPQKEEYLQIQLRSVFVEQNVRENPPPVELPKEVWEKLSRDKEIHPDDLPSGITLDDVRKAREAYYEKPSRPVLEVLADARYQHAIILGDPGSGKSTLARYVMLSLIEGTALTPALSRWAGEGGMLPLLIELRSYAGLCADDKCNSFLEFLEYLGKTEGWHLTQAALHNHLKNDGRAVVIFDGLDEIFDPELRETITNRIVGFTTDYPKARVIVTSRVIGYRRKILTDAGFTHFTLQDLDEKQVETFVNRWYDLAMSDRPDEAKERRERILKSFKESASIRQLAGNPMLLTIMAIIGKHQELPRERWKLYDHAASVLIQHWDVNKHLKDARIDADFIGEDDKKELLRRLAFRMQSGDGGLAGNYIHREHLQEEFENYLKERYAQTPANAKVITEAMIQQFRDRNFILSLYGANLYGFVHRAFLEYFCASAFVWKFEKTKEFDIERLKTDVYAKHWEDQSWHEVLRLICGMIDEKWNRYILEYLMHQVNSDWNQSSDRLPWNVALSVQVLSEVRNLNALDEIAKEILLRVLSIFNLTANSNELYLFFDDAILPFVERIGIQWPHRIVVIEWLNKLNLSSFTLSTEGKVVKIFVNEKEIHHWKDNFNLMPFMFASSFSRLVLCLGLGLSNLKNVLIKCAQSPDELTRFLALFPLTENGLNEIEIKQFLSRVATNDPAFAVRFIAMFTLANGLSADPITWSVLQKQALEGMDTNTRIVAIRLLSDQCFLSPETVPFLEKIIKIDNDENIRLMAKRGIERVSEKRTTKKMTAWEI